MAERIMLNINHIAKTFNPGTITEKRALTDVDLKLNEGDFVTIIGGNGAGKSTTLNAVAGVFAVDQGTIEIAGVDVTRLPEYKRAKYLGRVFQDPMTGTAATMNIEENMALAMRRGEKRTLRWGISNMERDMYREQLRTLGLGLEERMSSKVGLLSGGQRQRVMIAMALLCNPKLLIADEPTTALDVTIQAQILSLLKELRDQLGIAVILITHNMGVVAAVCDRMLVMYGGAVVEEGKCTELFENPCHPYTRGLLAAIPSIKERKEKLYTIPGQVPKMKVPVQYCRFCSRCSYAQEVCHEKEPGMQGENGHLYKCFYTPQQQEEEKCGPGGVAL